MKQLVVTGIGTEVGKTYVSAVLVAGLGAKYWKPIQSGLDYATDAARIRKWLDLPDERFIPSVYELSRPESPHSAAAADGVVINSKALALPNISGNLIIEGAGGVMVPLSEHLWYIDILEMWRLPIVLVIDGYLGCINHSLLTWEALMKRGIKVEGIIFNRVQSDSAAEYILKSTGAKVLGYLPYNKMFQNEEFKACFDEHISL